jgi:Pre-mRNA splicing Prp18-interacting factor.
VTVCAIVPRTRDHCSSYLSVGAKIAADEFIQPELAMDYDGKRDRWSGYDPSEHKAIIEEYQKIEEAKRQMRAEKLNSAVDGDIEVPELFPRVFENAFLVSEDYVPWVCALFIGK